MTAALFVPPADVPGLVAAPGPAVYGLAGIEFPKCATCAGRPRRPKHRVEGGSLSCEFCNRTFTFNMMRDTGPHRCSCERARRAACETCFGSGEVLPVSGPVLLGDTDGVIHAAAQGEVVPVVDGFGTQDDPMPKVLDMREWDRGLKVMRFMVYPSVDVPEPYHGVFEAPGLALVLTNITTDIPCPNDCARFGGNVPGWTVRSNWDWVPCPTCPAPLRYPAQPRPCWHTTINWNEVER